MTIAPRPIAVIVCCELDRQAQLEELVQGLASVWSAGGAAARLVVPYGESRPEIVATLEQVSMELDLAIDSRWLGEPRTRAVNAALSLALDNECDALMLDPGIEVSSVDWIERLRARTEGSGRPAAVVGGRLLDGAGDIHRAGYWFSRLTRTWSARLEHAPADVVQAAWPCRCPVPDAFSLIRYETLQAVGVYDESLEAPLDAIDYCLRVYAAGLDCLYEPGASAICRRPVHRAPTPAAKATFDLKWHGTNFSPWVPPSL